MSTRTLGVMATVAAGLMVAAIALIIIRSTVVSGDSSGTPPKGVARPALPAPVQLVPARLPVSAQRGCVGGQTSMLIQWKGEGAPRIANLPMTHVEAAPRGNLIAGTHRGRLVVVNPVSGDAEQIWPTADADQPPGATFRAKWARDGQRLVATTSIRSADGTTTTDDAFVWSSRTKKRTPLKGVWSAAWSASGRFLLVSTDGQDEVRTGDGRRTTARVPATSGPGDFQEVGWIPERDILIVTVSSGESDGHSWLMWPTGTRQRVGPALRAEGYGGELGRVVTSPDGRWAAGVTEENVLIRMALGRTKAEVVTQDLTGLTTSATIPPRFFTLVDPPEPVAPYMRVSAISNQGTVALSATRHIGDADYFVDALFWLSRDGSILFGTPTEPLFDLDQDDTTPAIVLHQSRDSERVVAVLPPFATRLAVASPSAGAAWSIVERDFDSAIVDDAVRFAAVRTTDGDVSVTALTSTVANRLIARNTRAWKRATRPTDPRLSLGWALNETAVIVTCSEPG